MSASSELGWHGTMSLATASCGTAAYMCIWLQAMFLINVYLLDGKEVACGSCICDAFKLAVLTSLQQWKQK